MKERARGNERSMDIKILIAMHKQFEVPKDPIYVPLLCGKCGRDIPCLGDDTGDHISSWNPYFCELTGLYWAWKNLSCDIIGLCHYRRYLVTNVFPGGVLLLLRKTGIEAAMKKYDVILPKKVFLGKDQTIFEQYAKEHIITDLNLAREVLQEIFPDDIPAFDAVMKQHAMYAFNMFCMRKPLFDSYCAWLFPVLFALEKRIDYKKRDRYQKRVFGFLSERLFNVWIYRMHLRTVERNVRFFRDDKSFRNWLWKKINF